MRGVGEAFCDVCGSADCVRFEKRREFTRPLGEGENDGKAGFSMSFSFLDHHGDRQRGMDLCRKCAYGLMDIMREKVSSAFRDPS